MMKVEQKKMRERERAPSSVSSNFHSSPLHSGLHPVDIFHYIWFVVPEMGAHGEETVPHFRSLFSSSSCLTDDNAY